MVSLSTQQGMEVAIINLKLKLKGISTFISVSHQWMIQHENREIIFHPVPSKKRVNPFIMSL